MFTNEGAGALIQDLRIVAHGVYNSLYGHFLPHCEYHSYHSLSFKGRIMHGS
jgi:hypothetical protein